MSVKVSVVIPTYNSSCLLKDSTNSVLAQSFKDFELLLIDDGSTDDTALVVQMVNDPRLKYHYKENGGVSSARNFGIDKASGEFIAFLDADDIWYSNYLETMISALEKEKDYGVAYTTIINKYPNGRTIERRREKHCVSGFIAPKLFEIFFVHPQASVVRRKTLDDLRFDEGLKLGEDGDFFLRLSLKTKFLFIPSNQVVRRVQTDSLSQRAGKNKVDLSRLRVLERFCEDFGGKELVSKRTANIRFCKAYREAGTKYYEVNARKAALYMYKRALRFDKLSIRNYRNFIKAFMLSKGLDTMPDWHFPNPLPLPIVK